MTQQIPGPLPPPPLEPPDRPAGRRHTVLAVVFSVVGVLLVAVVVAGFLIHLPYVIISPGSATPARLVGGADRRRDHLPAR